MQLRCPSLSLTSTSLASAASKPPSTKSIPACAAVDTSGVALKPFANAELRYKAALPDRWSSTGVENQKFQGIPAKLETFIAPPGADGSILAFNIITADAGKKKLDTNLKKNTESVFKELKKQMKDVDYGDLCTTTFIGQPAHYLSYSGTVQGVKLTFGQMYAFQGKRFAVGTFVGTPGVYGSSGVLREAVFKSVTLT